MYPPLRTILTNQKKQREIEAKAKGAEETENDSNVGAMCQITYHHFISRIEVILAETQNIAIRCGGDP